MAADFLAAAARDQPDTPALDDGGRGWSYRELGQRAGAAAHRLRGVVASGSTVALVSETTGDAVMAVHAVLAAGAVLAPLNPRSTRDELRRALGVLKPELVLSGPEAWELASSAGGSTGTVGRVGWRRRGSSGPGWARAGRRSRPARRDAGHRVDVWDRW